MVRSALRKNLLRDIFRSPGRYLAILGIIMLGAGFFAGLRVTRDAIVKTGEAYLERSVFYDFELLSDLGFKKDAPGRLELLVQDVIAEGTVETDALVSFTEDDNVIHFMTLPSRVNLPELREGRLPQERDEVLLDLSAQKYFALGDELVLSSLNDPDTLALFSEESFIVVGFATSPLYLNYERGSTTLGTGQIACFAYVLPEAVTADYYTALYLSGGDLGSLYSEEYDSAADALEPSVTEAGRTLAGERYAQILADGRQELTDAEADYTKALADYEREKADAEKELDDAAVKLDDAAKELEQGRQDYADGEAALEQARADGEAALAAAGQELDDALHRLADGEQEYAEGLAVWQAGETAYNDGLTQYNNSLTQYGRLFGLYDSYLNFRNASDSVRAALSELLAEYSDISFDPALTPAEREERFLALWDENSGVLSAALRELITQARSLADSMTAEFGKTAAIAAFRDEIDRLESALNTMDDKDLSGSLRSLFTASTALYSGASSILNEVVSQVPGIRQQLSVAAAQLAASRAQLAAAKQQLDAARKELDDGWDAYFAGSEQLAEGRSELARQLAEAEAQLSEAWEKLTSGQTEYEDGVAELAEAREEAARAFAEAEEELADARLAIDEGWQKLAEIEEPALYTLGRWSNIGYACLQNDSQIVASVARVFPVFFFLVAALICMTSMTRMVEEQRGQIGVLMALGYSRASILRKFLIYAGSAALIGCGIGIPLFSLLFPQIIWQAYRIMYSFSARLTYYMDWPLYGLTSAAYLAAMLLVTWLSLRGKLGSTPAAMLRPKAPKLGKRVLLERIPFLWNHLNFMWKVTMRNIFRYTNRVLMMLLGVAGCTALMITGYGIRDSIQDIVTYQYGEITKYEYEVTFLDPLTEETREEFSKMSRRYAGDALFVSEQNITAISGKTEKSAYLLSVANTASFSDYLSLHHGSDEIAFPGRLETVINNGLADTLGLRTGDTLRFSLESGEQYELTVSGIFDNYIYNYVLMSDETYELLTGSAPEQRTALVLKRDGGSDATARLLGADGVINVTAGSVLKDRIGSIMDNLIYIVLLTIICAAALAFIVIYNLININITERIREIATVKVLGFYSGESAVYVLRENILLTALGALLGVPLGLWLNNYVMSAIKVDLVTFEARVKFPSFLYAIGFTLLFSVLVYLIMMRKLEKIDMAAALKAAE